MKIQHCLRNNSKPLRISRLRYLYLIQKSLTYPKGSNFYEKYTYFKKNVSK